MGCDIHAHWEIKIEGEWEHYECFNPSRNYYLFARMADVRNEDNLITPIAKPRGLPDDISTITRIDYSNAGYSPHHESFLNAKEIRKLYFWFIKIISECNSNYKLEFDHREWRYLFSNGFEGFYGNPSVYPSEIQDLRIVFWFDN